MDILQVIKKTVESIKAWTDENKVSKVSGKGLSTNDYTTTDKNKVANMANDLVVIDSKLYLAKDGIPIENTAVTLPSGGGSSSSVMITLKNLLDSNTLTVAVGGEANLEFSYASSEYDGNGTAYIYVGGVLKGTATIVTGDNKLDISEYIGEGTNEVKLTCMDIYSNSKSLSYTVNAINLKITSTFDDSQIYSGDISVRYIPYGAIEKTIHFVVDGVDTTAIVSETGKQQTQVIPELYHGAHLLKIYATATIGTTTVKSNELLFDILYIEDGATTPMIASAYSVTSVTQGELINIPFTVYDPSNMETEITLTVLKDGETYSTSTRTVDRTRQTWSTRDCPVGRVTFTIAYGNIKKSHIITVVENDIKVSIKETDLEFQLKAAGKSNTDNDRDVWASGDVTTTFEYINWESTGWVNDENGDTALRLSGDAKATINFMPFNTDARQTGRTIEMEFAIRDVNNREAVAISCLSGGIGFTVTADTATLTSEQSAINCKYTDEKKVLVSFVIEPKSDYRLMSVYLNGVQSKITRYVENDNLQQTAPVNITVGSPYCSVDLYSIRSYNTALTKEEIRDNYIASIQDVGEQLAVFEDNNIYDDFGNLSYSKLQSKIPSMIIIGDLPTFKGDKKKVTIVYYDPQNPSLCFEAEATIDVQGTSSQWYVVKNFKTKTSDAHQLALDQIPTRVFCFKADYAEATGTHNTGTANFVQSLYNTPVPAQEVDDRVRTTIYGHPGVIFHKKDSSSEPTFVGKYNCNHDKGSEETFGFTSDYPDVQSVEFCNNTSDACLFHGPIPSDWSDDFEFRYPDGHKDISAFKVMHDWVVGTYQVDATGEELESSYTGVDGDVYTHDTAEYRLAKFKKEFEEHFDMEYALVYYVYTFFALMVDQRAKNLFLTSWDKKKWLCYYYDNDTIYGINNQGDLVLDYYYEDKDQLGDAYVFNGATSTLWVNFKAAFWDKIQEKYRELRSDKRLSKAKLEEAYITNQANKWSISVYNEDSDYKYVSMVRSDDDASNLGQVRGTGVEHLLYMLDNRFVYCDSMWYAGNDEDYNYPDDYVSLRIYTPVDENDNPRTDLVVTPNANITATYFSSMYGGAKYKANGTLLQERVTANVPVTFIPPVNSDTGESEKFNNTETAVFGASQLSSLGDLSALYCGSVKVAKAKKLTELIVGSGIDGYKNENLWELEVGTNKLLQKVDVRNCPKLVTPLGLANCPNIQEIYATGSGITGVELPKSGYLKKVYLPGTLTNLTVTNQKYIQEFELEGYDNLTTLRIEDTVNIPVEDIMLNAPNLNRIRLIDVQWETESEAALVQTIEKFKTCLGLDANGNNTDTAIVTGRVHVAEKVSDTVFGDIYNSFPDLVVDDGSEEIYIVNYKDRDGRILYSTRVAEGASAIDPIERGYIEKPEAIITDTYRYEFIGWSTLPTNINRHYIIIAQYHTKFAIKFYNGSEHIYSQWSVQGDAAEDPVVNGLISIPTKTGTNDISYKFSGWDNLPTNVQSSTSVYAQYDTYWAARFWNDKTLYLTEWVVDGGTVESPKDHFNDYINPTRESTAQHDYHFSSWDGDFETPMTSAREFYATYYNTIRKYNIYFYNDDELLYTVEDVPYGGSASYVGAIPTKLGVADPDEYVFKGWMPLPENIVGETYCYALFKFTGYLFGKLGKTEDTATDYGWVDSPNWTAINAYWDVVETDVMSYKNGTLSEDDFKVKYPIGGRMMVPVNLTSGDVYADVEIIGHNHDNLSDGSGKAPLTFFCVDLPQILHRMNEDSINDGGWQTSEMREFINVDLFNSLPSELRSIIKPVYKISDGGSTNKTLVTTIDSCWLASYDEVGLTPGNNNLSGQGELYSSIFSSDKNSRKKYITDDTATGGWWLRTSYYSLNSDSMFWRVTNSGGSYSDIAFNNFYVAFGFCI